MTTLPRVLLVEPQFVLRRTIAIVARDLGMVDFHEASNVARARTLLATGTYEALVLDLEEGQLAIDLLSDVRQGKSGHPRDLKIIVLAADLPSIEASRLQEFGVRSVMKKPVRITDLLNAVVEPTTSA